MIIVNILGVALIGLIVWWFWLYHPRQAALGEGDLLIVVENGVYQPSRIKLPADQSVTLNFLRKDASPCAETVVIPDLQISETLPVNHTKAVRLPPMKKGEYAFHCQMQMYRGQLTVE